MAADDEEDEDERTQMRAGIAVPARPVTATFLGKRLEEPKEPEDETLIVTESKHTTLPKADPRAMAMMKKSSLEIRTPELALSPQALVAPPRAPAATIEEETSPTMPFVPEARAALAGEVDVHISGADDEPDTITKREALSDGDILGSPTAHTEPDSITPQASVNMLELLRKVARPSFSDSQESAMRPARPIAKTMPLMDEATPEMTRPLVPQLTPDTTMVPLDPKVLQSVRAVVKPASARSGNAVDALARTVVEPPASSVRSPMPSPPESERKPVATKPKRRRWPLVLFLLVLIGLAIGASQSAVARAKMTDALMRISR